MGPDAMILVFWMLSFKTTFSLSSFTFIKRLFSSLLSAISVVSSAYLRLLIFLPAIVIPACASFSPAFLMMYSAYKLNKEGDNIQPWCTPFPIWSQSVVPCPVLTVAFWPAYRFLGWEILVSSIKSFLIGSPGGSDRKEPACSAGDPGSIPGSGRSPGKGKSNPLQYSCLENSTDRGAWQATVHEIKKSWTRLSD